jgi:hypothetical protein
MAVFPQIYTTEIPSMNSSILHSQKLWLHFFIFMLE